jgi:hypothetical protein
MASRYGRNFRSQAGWEKSAPAQKCFPSAHNTITRHSTSSSSRSKASAMPLIKAVSK